MRRTRLCGLVVLLLTWLLTPALATATVLGTAAQNTPAGTWSQLPTGSTPGWNNGQIFGPNGGSNCTILQYQGKAVWNPASNRFQVAAAAHGDGGACGPSNKTVVYDDATSTWVEGPQFAGGSDPQHMYDGNAMMPNGTHIATGWNSLAMKLWPNNASPGGGSWTVLANIPQDSSIPTGEANVYFPDYPGGAKIIHFNPAWGVWTIDPTTGATACIGRGSASSNACNSKPQVPGSLGDHNVSATYTVLCHCVMLGSTGAWVRLDSSGNFTAMSQSGGPSGYGSGDSVDAPGGQFAVDPVSGKILMLSVQNPGDGAMRQFDPTAGSTGTWTTVMANSSLPAVFRTGNGSNGASCTGVPLYGVIMCAKSPDGQNWPGAQVWIYKHTASGPVNPTLTVTKDGTGTGTVAGQTASGQVIDCGALCSAALVSGTSVTLTAPPNAGSTFTGWSGGGCSGTGSCVTSVTANVTINATFTAPQFTLTVAKAGTGTGTVTSSPAGISCGGTCSALFVNGTAITLTASPTGFTGWSGGGCSGTGTCVVTLSANTTVTASFAAGQTSADQDFANRCHNAIQDGSAPSADGVIKSCYNFDTPAQVATANGIDCWGCPFGPFSKFGASSYTGPTIDTSTKTSGAGSLKFLFPAGSGSDGGGSWFTRFSRDNSFQIGPGACTPAQPCEVWIQYRYRPEAGAITKSNSPDLDANHSATGFKLSHVGSGDTAACNTGTGKNTTNCPSSCSDMEIVIDPSWKDGGANPPAPMLAYANCGASVGQPILNVTRDGGGTYDIHPNWTGTPTRNCLSNTTHGEPNCFVLHANEWHTIKMHVKVTGWNDWNSNTIEIFAAHDGQPTQLIIKCGAGVNCSDNNNATVQGFFLFNSNPSLYKMGKIWLDPYITNQGGPIQPYQAWFDELIISTQDIPDPGAGTPPANPNLSVVKTGTGTGTVTSTSSPTQASQINCGATCLVNYPSGTIVTLTAAPTSGSFTGWSGGGCAGAGACQVTLTSDQTVTATFTVAAPNPTLSVAKVGTGSGTVSSTSSPTQASQINCGGTCATAYPSGTQVTLTASPTVGTFTGWSGGGCSGPGPCVTTLNANTTVTATFTFGGTQQFGLEWPGTGDLRRMLYWANPHTNGLPAYPATYVFQAFPRRKATASACLPGMKTGYYTMFFWGNNGPFAWNAGGSGRFYGMHPYPGVPFNPPCAAGTWEESLINGDWFFPAFPNQTEVVWDRWYTQVIRVQATGPSSWHYEFYFDWPDQTKVISQDASGSDGGNPPNPAVVIGQAPDICGVPPCESGNSWGGYPGWEEYNGILRGIQIYSQYLSLTEIGQEVASPKSSPTGASTIWYLNLDPRPSDVTDKKATGTPHNPAWAGTTAIEWSSTGGTPTPPAAPSNLRVTTP